MTPTRVLLCCAAWYGAIAIAAAADAPVRFDAPVTRVHVGRERVIAFRVEVGAADRLWTATIGDPGLIVVLAEPTALAGHGVGYVRVRGRRVGRTSLNFGGASLAVNVVAPVCSAIEERPAISWPLTSAAVWGTFGVGVEIDRDALPEGGTVELVVGARRRLEPASRTETLVGPTLRFAFDVDVATVPAGWLRLVPVVRAGSTEVPGDAVEVWVVHPEPRGVEILEAEGERDDALRPENWSKGFVIGQADAGASGEECVRLGDPAPFFPVEVPSSGWYQLAVRARGENAGGTWPTIAVYMDKDTSPATSSPLVSDRWHRVPLGLPVRLQAGRRVVTLAASYGTLSQLAYVDTLELLRLQDAPDESSAGASMMAMAPRRSGPIDGSGGLRRPDLVRVSFARALDGQHLTGGTTVDGVVSWRDSETTAPPAVALVLNGHTLAVQRSAAPRFELDASAFRPGPNAVQLVARTDGGAIAQTPVHTLVGPAHWKSGPAPRAVHRLTALEPGWDEAGAGLRGPPDVAVAQRAVRLGGTCAACLALPEELVGTFDVAIEGLAEQVEASAPVAVTLEGGKEARPLGVVAVATAYGEHSVGRLTLARGPKAIRFSTAIAEGEAVWVYAVVLRGASPADVAPPRVEVLWPPVEHAAWGADVVVVEASDDRSLAWVEGLIDGVVAGARLDCIGATGPLVLPLLLRTIPVGTHELAVRVGDAAGKEHTSGVRTLTVLEAAPPASRYARAVWLLNRLGFGPDARELAAILVEGEEPWLVDRLRRDASDPGDRTAWDIAFASYPYDGSYDFAVTGRVLHHALVTPNPVRTRLVHWADNHFSTWIMKTYGQAEWQEHQTFARLGAAPFRELLFASARSPAMLTYLDQVQSVATGLNENYAREVMELHTVGVAGGYTQADVTALARLLTGWTATTDGDGRAGDVAGRVAFRFHPQLHSNQRERLLGLELGPEKSSRRYDRPRRALAMLAAHPSTAAFVSRKLAAHYLGPDHVPDELVAKLADVFHRTDGDLAELVVALAAHPAFWASTHTRVLRPLELALRLGRAGGGVPATGAIEEFLGRSAMGMFGRPTPDGWPEEDAAWTNTNAMLQRWRLARELEDALATVVPDALRYGEEPIDAGFHQMLVDQVAVRLLGVPLTASSNAAALDVLAQTPGGRDELVRAAVAIVCQLPEAQSP